MAIVFETLIRPGIRLMQNLRLPAKFAIISAAFLVPLAVAVYGVLSYAKANIEFSAAEQTGSAYIAPMNDLLHSLGTPAAAPARGSPRPISPRSPNGSRRTSNRRRKKHRARLHRAVETRRAPLTRG